MTLFFVELFIIVPDPIKLLLPILTICPIIEFIPKKVFLPISLSWVVIVATLTQFGVPGYARWAIGG